MTDKMSTPMIPAAQYKMIIGTERFLGVPLCGATGLDVAVGYAVA
jgi:hypothetical protein